MMPSRNRGFAAPLATILLSTVLFAQPSTLGLRWDPAIPLGSRSFGVLGPTTPLAAYGFDLSTLGTSPGFTLGPGNGVFPLNRPLVYLDLFGASPTVATVFSDFYGLADVSGWAYPSVLLPDDPNLVGLGLDAASLAAVPGPGFVVAGVSPARHCVLVGSAAVPSGLLGPFRPAAPTRPATRYVSPTGNNANNGLSPQTAWREIRHAATLVGPGDVVEIADGNYLGPVLVRNVAGTANQPLIFRATGSGAILTGSANTNNDDRNSIFIGSSSHVWIHGLRVFSSLRSGVRISLSDHVTIQACVFGNHQKWGIFTDYADDLRLLGNECYGSIDEHGIYHSNSGDRAVIVGNHCHDNRASGIQINADPLFLAPIGGYVPDGISSECVVARNLCVNNGELGGAAINLASVRRSVIRNNLILNDAWLNSTGIALWDDGAGPIWGCRDNIVEHNTVAYNSGRGRYAVSLLNGSTGNQIRNNVLRGGRRGALAFTADCLPGLVAEANLYFSVDNWPVVVQDDTNFLTYTLSAWQALGRDPGTVQANPAFISPAGIDYGLLPGTPGSGTALPAPSREDHGGQPRPQSGGPDRGAFER